MRGTYHGSALLYAGHVLHECKVESGKPEAEREDEHRERNRSYHRRDDIGRMATEMLLLAG
jgi:hypothetical protein